MADFEKCSFPGCEWETTARCPWCGEPVCGEHLDYFFTGCEEDTDLSCLLCGAPVCGTHSNYTPLQGGGYLCSCCSKLDLGECSFSGCGKLTDSICDVCGRRFCEDHGHYEPPDPFDYHGDDGGEALCEVCIEDAEIDVLMHDIERQINSGFHRLKKRLKPFLSIQGLLHWIGGLKNGEIEV